MQIKSMENNYLKQSSKIPRSVKIFFLTLHVIFGQDFGFGNLIGNKKTAQFFKYYSAILALSMFVCLLCLFKTNSQELWYWCILLGCVVSFGILKTTKYTVYNLLCEIHAAEKIDVLEKETFGVITSLYVMGMFLVNAFIYVIPCLSKYILYHNEVCIDFALYSTCYMIIDLMPEAQIFVRFYIYASVKNMARCLEQDQDLNNFVNRYNKIADCQDKIRRLCDCVTLMELFINIPKIMISAWYALNFIEKCEWTTTIGEWVITFHLVIQIVIPAIIMQLTKCSMNDIRQLLNTWNMVERDPVKNAEIARIMKYLKRRSLHYKIWGIIPTDLRLPLTLISICTTYLIVIIQFTHLYD